MSTHTRLTASIIAVIALVGVHLAALHALLHPKVTREYRAYYIDRVTRDWHVQHYPSTPEEGIELAKPGWPDFVEYSFGISVREGDGRWTDTRQGLKAGFEFNRSFNGPVCVVLNAGPSDPMRDHHVTLAFGDQQKDISFGQDQNFRLYAIDFKLSGPTTRLELRFPGRLPRASLADGRQVGVRLNRIQVFSQPCSAIADLAAQGH